MKQLVRLGFGLGLAFLGALPLSAHAMTAELISGGDTLTDISEMMEAPSEEIAVVGFTSTDPIGTTYDLEFSVDEEPAVLVVLGEILGEGSGAWAYDEDTGILSVSVASADFGDVDVPQSPSFLVLGISGAVPDGEDGPPAEAAGMYMATNVLEWEMMPPGDGSPTFGFELTGPVGHQGFFDMFIPNDLMGYLDTNANDMALYVNGDQSNVAVKEVAGGALYEITTTFSASAAALMNSVRTAASEVTVSYAAGDAQGVSLSLDKTEVKKGGSVELTGYIKSNKKGKTVSLWRKVGKADTWEKFDMVQTKKAGKYTADVTVTKKTKFQARWKNSNGKVHKSSVEVVTLK